MFSINHFETLFGESVRHKPLLGRREWMGNALISGIDAARYAQIAVFAPDGSYSTSCNACVYFFIRSSMYDCSIGSKANPVQGPSGPIWIAGFLAKFRGRSSKAIKQVW